MILTRGFAASAALALITLAAPAKAQDADAVRRALELDRLLGPNAALPTPPSPFAVPPLPPRWIAGQPYRQQPLFATVPVGGKTTSGRVRAGGR